ncbi:tetratricopeptide repeat protein [Skermanella mucosa]|uniref:alpha/beta fold hydrolase n=1 Tax=Skermanella mucosa TaxID=1789672 RepID=UPI00192BC40B|nr:tetratricopeptide repeat protein [Skermanella mucosa]UEM22225.1 tetratricopeptide repeat protein [Skermanella mucosa]
MVEWFRLDRNPDSDVLAVVFSHVSEQPGRFSFYGSFRDIAVNKLFVNTPGNGWYRDGVPGLGDDVDSTADGIRILMQQIAPRTVVCVGNSMGAYAALLFGVLINADRVLAIGPETLLDQPGSRSRGFLAGRPPPSSYADLLPVLSLPAADRRTSIVIGESDPSDVECARRVAHLPGMRLRSMRGVGHEVPAMLHRFGAWRPLIRDFVRDGSLPALLPLEGRIFEAGDAAEALVEGRRLRLAGNLRAARARLGHCLALYPDADLAHDEIGIIEREEGAFARAEAAHRLALRLAPDRAQYSLHLAQALEAQGRFGDALAAYDQACAVEPGNRFLGASRDKARDRLRDAAPASWGTPGLFQSGLVQKDGTPATSAPLRV